MFVLFAAAVYENATIVYKQILSVYLTVAEVYASASLTNHHAQAANA